MLVVETVVRIRREHAGGKPIKAIARDLRLSRKVVRKAIRGPRVLSDGLDAVEGAIREALDAGAASDEVILNILSRRRLFQQPAK
jgi:hypothetical protein